MKYIEVYNQLQILNLMFDSYLFYKEIYNVGFHEV